MVNFCLFGGGVIGTVHGGNIAAHPEAKLRYVVDPDPEAVHKLANCHGAESLTDPHTALDEPEIDAVLIASSAHTHAELITHAARAGKPIFCEKPLDLDPERVETCVREVKTAGVPFQIGFHRRFDAHHRAVHASVRSGDVGQVELVSITSRDSESPALDYFAHNPECLWKDMMIHDFDMARWLLGEEPTEIFAAASCLVEPDLERLGEVDTAMVTLRTASGALCHINASLRTAYGYDQRTEVFGSKGMVAASNLRPTTVERHTAAGTCRDNLLHFFLDRYTESYRSELDHFIDALRNGTPPSPGIEDGRRALLLAVAGAESNRTGAPIKLSGLV